MKMLMSRGLEYCTPKNSNCILHHYINTFDLENNKQIKKILTTFFNRSVHDFTINDLNKSSVCETDYDYFNIRYLYENFIETSNVITQYKTCIQFTWKGLPYSLSDLFQNAQSDFIYPNVLRTLYDMFFKFYVSVVYWRIKKVLISTNLNVIQKKFEKISTCYPLVNDYFPEEIKPFIIDIKSVLTFTEMSNINTQDAMNQLTRRIEKVDKLLNTFNIILNLSCKKKKWLSDINLFSCPKSCDIFSKELSAKVKFVTDLFKKLNKFGITL